MIVKRLDEKNVLIRSYYFPYRNRRCRTKKYRVLVGIGGNVGDVPKRFAHLMIYWRRSVIVDVRESSLLMKNPPFGYLDQPDFYNATVAIETNLRPVALLNYFLHTEKHFGRKRLFQDAPRTLDIDILFYEEEKIEQKNLIIPHLHWCERPSVNIPLSTMQTIGLWYNNR